MEVSLPSDFLVAGRKKALGLFTNSLEISGFRKGHVPENVVIEKVGEAGLLEEAVNILIKEHFPKIVEQEKLDILGQPKISITKLALGNPVEFKAVFAVMPEIELPDYRKIAASSQKSVAREEPKAEEKEIEDVLLQIRKNKAHFDYHKNNPEDKGHNHTEIKDEDLPPLDDELAKEAGNFKDLNELKEKVRQNIIEEKKIRNTEKKRAAIMEGLVKNTKIDLPEILVASETEKSLAQMKNDVERMGGKFEDYLSHAKKSEEDLKKDLKESSEKKAKIQLIFNKIAEVEKLEPNKEILENEVKQIMEHYKDASETSARIYVATILINQEVLKLLEKE
ncbi:MAG: Trigger factor [Candidatus Woesebacteria bacterium GW2011_GWA1_39_8]|uniref:Trigger factor n=1 Tax=Candidatus Woesebacteria bacterium GW2011_GWA1_39_8 TaxID=1618552 RepID=A0A0G0SW49_9BACT|nr:MAG: Trigger factor [Candidatus Woesebacteria bacterium GW2011_GWA1_39_8]